VNAYNPVQIHQSENATSTHILELLNRAFPPVQAASQLHWKEKIWIRDDAAASDSEHREILTVSQASALIVHIYAPSPDAAASCLDIIIESKISAAPLQFPFQDDQLGRGT
jgi:hypothetical protein